MKKRLLGMLLTIVALCCLVPVGAQAAQRVTVSDPSTIWDWGNLIKDNTSNVGRIWTDKTVSTDEMEKDGITIKKAENADFLTALTALSSTSNLSSTATTPLDIALVLDMSSSMTQSMGETTKLEALKSAANSFVDTIAKQNESISDADSQHRVAVVSFNSTAVIQQSMTTCAGINATNIKSAISALKTSQGTHSDYGLQKAQEVLTSSKRKGAKQIVVFFTDGTPTTSRTFDSAIASAAVTAAKTMKDAGAIVYTIGVLDGADPSVDPADTSVSLENKFMHAVSSNYPNATYSTSGSEYTWSFGDRAQGSDGKDATFYKSATSAAELAQIFADISKEITEGAGYPTRTTDGAESTSGYITFDDQLGDYMQVSDLSTLVYNGKKYTSTSKTTVGNVDTYHFSGTVYSGAAKSELSDLVVTVTRSDKLAVGDKVQVKIPAALIPLRHFNIDLTNKKMSVDENKPVSVFYSSSLKPGVTTLMANPDAAMKAYIEANSDDDGNVKFYANKWSGDKNLGDTTSQFEPASTNSYYYFTENTPIYSDEACTKRATSIESDQNYYYKHEYYSCNGDNEPVLKADIRSFPGSKADAFEGAIGTDKDGAYFKAGTARLVYINQLYKAKDSNITSTAKDVLNPKWNSETSVKDATTVTPHLGNNGVLTITNVTYDTANAGLTKVLEGRDWLGSDSFTFNLTAKTEGAPLPKDANGNIVTSITVTKADADADGKADINFGTMTYTWDMVAGESDKTKTYEYEVSEVSGSIAGITYDDHKATITVTVKDDGLGNLTATASVSGETFKNFYRSSLDYTACGGLKVAKTLTGRDMTEDQFSICVKPKDSASADALGISEEGQTFSVPAAADGEQAVVDVLDGRTATFTQGDAGKTYSYEVYELGEAPAGYTYDAAKRTVTISVNDDPTKAALTVTTTVSGGPEGTKTYVYPAEDETESATVAFFNSYSASTDVEGGTAVHVSGTKTLAGRDLAAGEFSFGVRLANSEVDVLRASNKADGSIDFGTLSYTTKSLAELVQGGCATKGKTSDGKPMWTINYVAYENTDGLAERGITAKTASISFKVTVVDNGDGTLAATANLPSSGLAFANQYATGDPVSVSVSGIKLLAHDSSLTPNDITGKFNFTISSSDPAAPLPKVTTVTNDASGNVDFGEITFTLDDLNRALGTTGKDAADEPSIQAEDATEGEPAAEGAAAESDALAGEEASAQTGAEAGTDSAPAAEEVPEAEVMGESTAGDTSAKSSDAGSADAAADVTASTDIPLVATDANGGAIALADNGESSAVANVSYRPVAFTLAANELVPEDASEATVNTRSYTFVYTVTESGTVAGVTNDASTKTVAIKVTDDGEGHLTAELVGEKGKPAFAFTNSYDVTPVESSVTDQITITKKLTGRDLVAGEFTFELLEGATVVATGTNDADGTVTFSAVAYAKPGVHYYTVREVGAGTTAKGVTCDGTSYQVVTTVTDDGQGGLSVTHELAGNEAIVFNNTYAAAPTTLVIDASKTLSGVELKDGQFTFKLAGGGIELVAKNKADGTIAFPTITFDQVGTYTFEVYEVNDVQANVTYDSTHYTVTVEVTDDGEGNLVAQVTSENEGALTFANTYAEPTPEPAPSPKGGGSSSGEKGKSARTIPQTGDDTAFLMAILAAAGFLTLSAAAKLRQAHK